MADSTSWTARRILAELCSPELRSKVLTSFWSGADEPSRKLVLSHLATLLRFRPETLRKASSEKRASLVASRLAAPELRESLEASLLIYHTQEAAELMAAFLDSWKIPHEKGSIESDDYPVPNSGEVAATVTELRSRFAPREIALYLAAVGLLMGGERPEWRAAVWPVVDALATELKGG